jgi:hypothetical protein
MGDIAGPGQPGELAQESLKHPKARAKTSIGFLCAQSVYTQCPSLMLCSVAPCKLGRQL